MRAVASDRHGDTKSLSLNLPRHTAAESIARREIALWHAEGRSRVAVGDLQLAASELVTNAVLHGTGEITLDAQATRDTASLQVCDQGEGFALPRDRRQGSGLDMVDAVCDRWGVGHGTGNVWCEFGDARALRHVDRRPLG